MKRLQQLEPGLNAYKVSFDSSLLNTLRTMFDSYLRERLSRQGYAYLFTGQEKIDLGLGPAGSARSVAVRSGRPAAPAVGDVLGDFGSAVAAEHGDARAPHAQTNGASWQLPASGSPSAAILPPGPGI